MPLSPGYVYPISTLRRIEFIAINFLLVVIVYAYDDVSVKWFPVQGH